MIATFNGQTFTLRGSDGDWRWFLPDGRPTDLCRGTQEEAQRAMMFEAPRLAAQASKSAGARPVRDRRIA